MKTLSALFIATLLSSAVGSASTVVQPKPSNDAIVDSIAAGRFDEVKSLRARGASLDAISSEGMTGLMKLAEEGDTESVHQLLAMGARLDVKNAKGESALWSATYGGHEDLALEMIAKGAKPDGVSKDANECLLHVAAKSQLKKLAEVLKSKTPKCLAMKNSDGKTPAEIAKGFGDDVLAKKLTPSKK